MSDLATTAAITATFIGVYALVFCTFAFLVGGEADDRKMALALALSAGWGVVLTAAVWL